MWSHAQNRSPSPQAKIFQKDFQQERKDHESTLKKVAEMETRYTHQLQTMSDELYRKTTELKAHQQSLANTEAVMQKRVQQLRQQMAEKERELGMVSQENAKLREEVQSKAQQEMEPLLQQRTIQKEQVSATSCYNVDVYICTYMYGSPL